ncbi:MAG: hypothetical protein NTW14_07225 [bacterium]|nr:hypothetical protein [bacterium]
MTTPELRQLYDAFDDPYGFMVRHLKTLDPMLGEAVYPDWPHLRGLSGALLESRLVLVVKSRQMMATWTALGLLLHRAIFGNPGVILLLSKNERSARELLDRLRFLIAGLPDHFRLRVGTNSAEELEFDLRGVRILSLPASPDAPRMHSPAGVIWDEMAFTPHSEEIWAALKPALDSGGFFWGISSSGGPGNLFSRLAKDGAAYGLKTHWLHYSEHPYRGLEWVEEARKGLTTQKWAREYEISFEAAEDRVYPEFQQRTNVLLEPYCYQQELSVYRSVDFGFYHPVALWLQRTVDDRIIVFDEWIGDRATVQDLIDAIRRKDAAHGFTESAAEWTSCDPAGHSPGESGVSPIERLKRAGVKVKARASRIEEGIDLVREALREREGVPGLLVSPTAARVIDDFHGYRLREDGLGAEKDNVHDHTMDALRYFIVNLRGSNEKKLRVGARVRGG